MTANFLAIDLGASSGRAVLGTFDGARLALRDVHRFANGPVSLPSPAGGGAGGGVGSPSTPSSLHWDVPRLITEIKKSITLAHRQAGSLSAIGIDTWGVDYGLLDASGALLSAPHHYRDPRTRDMMAEAFGRISRARLYEITGIQFLSLNTLYQLLADQRSGALTNAATLLFMPDLFNFMLTGVRRTEHTIASTSQFYDPGAGAWAGEILAALDLPSRILPEIGEPGSAVGTLLPLIARESGTGPVPVIAPGSHDTASAVAAAPALGTDWAYISSGTWSLVGRELLAPIRTPEAMAANFTNERGICGTIRFHKNVAGLWMLQECQRAWASLGRAYSFDELRAITLAAPPFAAFVDPDDPSFAEFGDMPARIREYCIRTRQPAPETEGAISRCVLEGLALRTRVVIDALKRLTGPVRRIHMVGGGVQNSLLCQFTADACGLPVLAGPVEATSAGNIMTQAMAHGHVSSLAQIREVIQNSFAPKLYLPTNESAWLRAYEQFEEHR